MRSKRIIGFVLGVAGFTGAAVAAPVDDPLTRPIAAEAAKRWLGAQPPVRIYGNSYLVGFAGLNVGLIKTSAGLILIDGAVPQAVADVEAHIRALGFRVEDIRLILSTEPHFDHAGGLAALVRDSGATVVASAPAAEVLRRGRSGPDDPQAGWLEAYPPVSRIRVVHDRATIRLGDTVVTAYATPGHTPGSMSWGWRACEGKRCLGMIFGSSLNPIAANGYRYSAPHAPSLATAFRRTFAVERTLPCDILITAHPDQSGGDVKLRQLQQQRDPNPFIDPGACRAYADTYQALFDKRIADELAGRTP